MPSCCHQRVLITNFAGERSGGTKARRMMGYIEKHPRKAPIALPRMEAPAPAPEPGLTPVLRLEKLS